VQVAVKKDRMARHRNGATSQSAAIRKDLDRLGEVPITDQKTSAREEQGAAAGCPRMSP
jgi:hypothetical protein